MTEKAPPPPRWFLPLLLAVVLAASVYLAALWETMTL